MFDQIPDELKAYVTRFLGALLGVIGSVIMVAPESTKNALHRIWIGVAMGIVFAPVASKLPFMGFLTGDTSDMILARATITGFVIWFVLEAVARLFSSNEWITKLAKEILNRGGDKK